MKNKKLNILLILFLTFTTLITSGFTVRRFLPHRVYRVYLKGESLGIIKSKSQLENYIDKKQNEIKQKYNVNKVYIPTDLDIVKEITYDDRLSSIEQIYNKIKNISPFTINGYAVTIKGLTYATDEGKPIKGKNQIIYVLDKDIFRKSVENTAMAFIPKDEYENYANNTQKKVEDIGKTIEKIYIQNGITLKKYKIPINKTIYDNVADLSKYLLFGTLDDQKTYNVKAGETIEEIAFNNKVSVNEFLIANPNILDENTLLYPGQKVTIGILKPQFNVMEVDHIVTREPTYFKTETRFDNNQYVGYSQILQKGSNGEERVTKIVQKRNGDIIKSEKIESESVVIKPVVNEIIIKGGKQSQYNGYGTVVPTKGEWGWPATCSSISSPFGWRWGTLHNGTDIAGCGYGSNIFAAQGGTVVESRKKPGHFAGGYGDSGEYIIIDHHNGYYTLYAHICPNCRVVKKGDTVVKGQVIGGMGRTGAATGVHLHFSLFKGYPYRGGIALNPMNYY